MDKIRVAMVLYTQGLQYDDRIRKEILSIQKINPHISFEIYAIIPENVEQHGVTDYGVPFHILCLKSREKYGSSSNLFYKAYDFYKTVEPQIKDFDVVWCADIETTLFPLLLKRNRPIIWDLHEIPKPFLRNWLLKRFFNYLEHKCSLLYHANQPRIDYLLSEGVLKKRDKNIAIRNYPEADLCSISVEPDEMFHKFCNWLQDAECVYIQGITGPDRRAVESVSSVMEASPDLRAVVVGNYTQETLTQLQDKYGEETLNKRIFFTGQVPQKLTKLYIGKCKIGLVFYRTNSVNNTLCEPNRLFQTLMMGLPVVVGCNPPMSSLVKEYNFGIALDNDGCDIDSIVGAIHTIFDRYDYFVGNIRKYRDQLTWESQEQLLSDTFIKAIELKQ